jgi:hypothetical protein
MIRMAEPAVIGVFDTVSAAGRTRTALLEAGIREDRISLSADLSEDAIAGEAPGQSYENQPGQSPEDSARAGYGYAVLSGVCVLSVKTRSRADARHVAALLRQGGARRTI